MHACKKIKKMLDARFEPWTLWLTALMQDHYAKQALMNLSIH